MNGTDVRYGGCDSIDDVAIGGCRCQPVHHRRLEAAAMLLSVICNANPPMTFTVQKCLQRENMPQPEAQDEAEVCI